MAGKVKMKPYELNNDFMGLAVKNRLSVIRFARNLLKHQEEEKAKNAPHTAAQK